MRRHPRGGATSPARGVQPPSRQYDDVEPDTDVVLKVFKFNISPRCKGGGGNRTRARTHTKPRIVQSNSHHMARLHLRPRGDDSVASRGSSMGNKCETSIILFVQQRRWLQRVKYRGGCGVWVESSLPTHTHFASSTSSCLCASVKSARASSASMVGPASPWSPSSSSASPTVPSAGPDAPSPEPARSSSEASLCS